MSPPDPKAAAAAAAAANKAAAPEFFLRPARLSDFPTLAVLNTHAYWNDPLHHNFLAPRASEHPEDMTREFRQKLRKRFLLPTNRTIVACPSSAPDTIVAFAQFTRLGDDSGARDLARSRGLGGRIWFLLLACCFFLLDMASNVIWKDRITDFANVREFEVWCAIDGKRYWDEHPERANRWHANSVVVAPRCQGQGIGRMLMSEVVAWAQEEKVMVGLTASPHGEHLYRKLGFEMVGDFYRRPFGGEIGGGFMIRYPVPEN